MRNWKEPEIETEFSVSLPHLETSSSENKMVFSQSTANQVLL
ncbi:MAG: hypothetical protein ACTSSG_03080 [Candidatus Heimdallarchaeaceae archaeon]